MTPTATTPAARRAAKGAAAAPGHRRAIRPKSIPRRISGPVRGRAASAASARPARRRARNQAPIPLRVGAFVRALPDHPLLDRIVRGRAWIPLLGVMLAGIVAMQVEVLKLGASMGRAIERGSVLQSRNEQLRQSVSSLADDQRIERLAANLGMVMPSPGAVGFLSARHGAVAKAASAVKAPDAAAFLATLNTTGALATMPTTTTPTPAAVPGPTSAASGTAGVPTGVSAGGTATSTVGVGPAGTPSAAGGGPTSTGTTPAATAPAATPPAGTAPAATAPAATAPAAAATVSGGGSPVTGG